MHAQRTKRDWPPYVLAVLLGLAAGYLHLEVKDPTLTALLVTMVAMGLALWKPERPWRWGLTVGLCVPAAQLFAYAEGVPPFRGEVQGAFVLGLISAFVAAFIGSMGRRAFQGIFSALRPDEPADENNTSATAKRSHDTQ